MPKRNVFVDQNKENIIKDYEGGLSLYEVSKKYNTSHGVIRTRLNSWGVKKHGTNYRNTLNITKEVLEDLHISKKMSYKDIANKLRVSYTSVVKYAKKYGLPRSTQAITKWSRKYDKCRECGTTKLKHHKNGHCVNCARKLGLVVYKWPKKYINDCILCGETTRPYKKDGLCSKCWNKEFYKDVKLQRKDEYEWSIEYPCCKLCGTTKHKHTANGICHKCIQRKNKNATLKICPVCGEKYVQIFRHWGQEILKKKNKKHTKYLKDLLEKHFNSNLGLDKIADDLQTSRHIITRWFNYFFGKQATKKRNEKVRCFLISSKAVENFPFGPQVKHPNYTDRLGREFKFRSQLEHTFAKWLDRNKTVWEYEIKTFSYNALDGRIRHYTPDFYFPEFDFYVELKGRKFDGTEYKIKQTEKESNIKIYTLWQKEILCSKVLQEAL